MKLGRGTRRKDVASSSRKEFISRTTTTRCKETHDVPYTLRCVLDEVHTVNLQPHVDKEGNEW